MHRSSTPGSVLSTCSSNSGCNQNGQVSTSAEPWPQHSAHHACKVVAGHISPATSSGTLNKQRLSMAPLLIALWLIVNGVPLLVGFQALTQCITR